VGKSKKGGDMNWIKVKVGDFLIRVKDLIPIEKDKEYNLVTIKLYHKGVQLRKRELGSNISADRMSRVKTGQFILSGIDARNGAFGIIPPELDGAVVTNDFWHFDIDDRIVSKEYFLWLTSTPYFDDICNKASDGTTNRIRLQADRFYTQELFIPDIGNQHEVVKELKKQGNKIDSLKKEFSYQLTLLDSLNQAILQEAVQGKLVMQDPKDEPASELLKRIKAEKAKSGKKEKPLPPIKPEEIPFEIPESWVWCRLGEICSKIGSGSTPKGSNYSKSGFPFFRSQNIYNDGLVYDDIKFVSDEVQKQMSGTIVLANDILLNITGGSMGRCALVPEDFEEGNVSQHVCIIRPLHINRNYFHKIVLSPYFQKFIFSSTTGAGREGLPKYNLEQFAIPLPPLSEQKRIVAEIEKQLAKTKQLSKHIIANQQATEQLLKALLHQAFEVREMEEDS
jgi:type I restriction enzyme S subunit